MSAALLPHEAEVFPKVERSVRRVCLVTEAAGGGVGRHFLDLAAGLAKRHIEVVAIYSPTRCDAQFNQRKSQLQDVHFVPLPLRRSVQPGDLLDLWKLIDCIRTQGPFDVIHGHSSKGGALARLAGWHLRTPTLYTPHAFVTLDPKLSSLKRVIFGRIERWLGIFAAAVIAVSPDEAEHAQQLGIESSRIRMIPNGILQPDFPPREVARGNLGLATADFAIGFVGRLVSQKAPDILLKAFAALATRLPNLKLVIVGSGPLEGALRRRVDVAGLGSRVLFTGDIIATQVMPAFDLFCLSSRYEGMTYVLLEALAAGLPIVATRVGGVTLCVEDQVNGLIVAPDDAQALAAAVGRLIMDRDCLRQYANVSAERSGGFTADRMVAATLELYEGCVSRWSVVRQPGV